jgi:rhodanese-related sulfurtransferase
MKRAWGLIIGLVLLAGVALPAHAEKWKEVNAQELKAMMDAGGVFVINPLSRIEFRELAIKGSINVPLDELEQKLPKDKGAKLVFYCLGPK